MNGMEMMMKSLGFDPEVLKGQAEGFKNEAARVIAHFNQRLSAIETQQGLIVESLSAVMQSQSINTEQLIAIRAKLDHDYPALPEPREKTNNGNTGSSN